MAEIAIATCDPRDAAAVACLTRYYNELNARLDHGFDVSLSADPEAESMIPPVGRFFLATRAGQAVGCVGLKGTGQDWSEVKRLWVAPGSRRLGLAHRLMEEVEAAARAMGLARLRLDTNSALPEAVALYRGSGWQEIARFNDDPYPDVFFEKRL